ncbi:MAG: iron ABC transporter permease [Rhodocyclaceae bacterium]|jgi:iron(III) transport system permease protein|nr:iron ABC transporter permease [Rhodocyclaceae bacterium]MBK6908970.1 iron ABC transporter permease [Rhodocyclaceae bacterium]
MSILGWRPFRPPLFTHFASDPFTLPRLTVSPLTALAVVLAFAVAMPVLSVAANLFDAGTSGTWAHLVDTVLADYILNSLWLCLGVGLGVAALGTGSAWLVALHEFPGRRTAEWALLLPMAMPAYVLAYVYTDFLQFVGPVQSGLREGFGWSKADYWFPEVRSLPGAIALFSFVLYPYVYLLVRSAFLERAAGTLEAARSLGLSRGQAIVRVLVPLTRPAIAAGVALALMETLADYGTVAYFALPTFTTGIYRAWFSLGDRTAAAQLAGCLLSFVLLLLLVERASRGRARYHDTSARTRNPRRPLTGLRARLALAGCAVPVLMGFALPAWLLVRLARQDDASLPFERFWHLAGNSVLVALVAAVLAAGLALLLAYAARGTRPQQRVAKVAARLTSLGYAVPGSVIAVGVLIPVTRLDHALGSAWQALSGSHPGLLLTGGIAALVYAYLARFLSIALQTMDAGFTRLTPSMDAVARSLGCTPGQTLRRVHLPVLRGSVLTAALLVFVDVMKELPATLVMRPFNFDTLATQTYTFAADERLGEAAVVSLAIVVVGLLPLIVLARQIGKGQKVSGC